jgi:deoxyribodipyrimidine photolyase-related protein
MVPNVIGMGLHADNGKMMSKPYAAGGAYISRMSTYCKGCAYDPKLRAGDNACPFTTLYWDFLMRHETLLKQNPRMAMQLKNVARLSPEQREAVTQRAQAILAGTVGSA